MNICFGMHENELLQIASAYSKLPQVYQPIYGYNEFFNITKVERKCEDRYTVIQKFVEKMILKSGNISILDIGCSQGWFLFKLKEQFKYNVNLLGIDILQENIDMCKAITEAKTFDIKFKRCRFDSSFIDSLSSYQYDITLMLSVIHHEARPEKSIYATNSSGDFSYAKCLLHKLLNKTKLLILELAVKDEFREDFADMPDDYIDWIKDAKFYAKIGDFYRGPIAEQDTGKTKSELTRPMLIVSNYFFYEDEKFTLIDK